MDPVDRVVPELERGLLGRRGFLALGAALAVTPGCHAAPMNLARIDLDTIGPDHVLVLGSVYTAILDLDSTDDTVIAANGGGREEVLLPSDGRVAWVVRRRRGGAVGIGGMRAGNRWMNGGPLLARATEVPISYFGAVTVELTAGFGDGHAQVREVKKITWRVDDRDGEAMRSFVDQNPALANRPYDHVLRKATLQAPALRRPLAPG